MGPAGTIAYFDNSVSCLLGNAPNPEDEGVCDAKGGNALVWFLVYLVFNIFFNVLMLWLTKRMSATWATIATVLCLDLSSLFSMSKALMGDEAAPLTVQQYMGLILAGIAMWVYNLKPEVDKNGNTIEGADGKDADQDLDRALPTCTAACGDGGDCGDDSRKTKVKVPQIQKMRCRSRSSQRLSHSMSVGFDRA